MPVSTSIGRRRSRRFVGAMGERLQSSLGLTSVKQDSSHSRVQPIVYYMACKKLQFHSSARSFPSKGITPWALVETCVCNNTGTSYYSCLPIYAFNNEQLRRSVALLKHPRLGVREHVGNSCIPSLFLSSLCLHPDSSQLLPCFIVGTALHFSLMHNSGGSTQHEFLEKLR